MKQQGNNKARPEQRFRILHTESSLGWGGQEIRVLQELKAMRARGHEVWLAAPPISRIYAEAEAVSIPVFSLDCRRLSYVSSTLRLARQLRENRVEVVNTHSSRDGWLGGIAACHARTPVLLRSRHIDVEYRNPWLSRFAFSSLADRVLTTSEKISRHLSERLSLDPALVSCIPTGVDVERFQPGIRGTLHEELRLPPDLPLVGLIAVIRSWKGHAVFVEAASLLRGRGLRAHFVVVGDGPGRDELRRRVAEAGLQDSFSLLGHRTDVPQIMASLAAFALPSLAHEGIPQAVLQAQAAGVPVVGTKVGGIPEVVAHEKTGLLVEPGDAVELADAIGRLLAEPQLRQSLCRAGRESVLKHHTNEIMCAAVEHIIRQVLKEKRRSA